MCLEFKGIRASVNISWYILCFPFPSDLVSAPILLLYYPKTEARAPPPLQAMFRGPLFGLLTTVPLPTGRSLWGQGIYLPRALLSSLVHTVEFLPMSSVLRAYTGLLPEARLSEDWPRSQVWPQLGIVPPAVQDKGCSGKRGGGRQDLGLAHPALTQF